MSSSSIGKVFNLTSGGNMQASVYDPTKKKTDVYAYAELVVAAALENLYEELTSDQTTYHVLCDSSDDIISDSSGNSISDSTVDSVEARIANAIK